MANKIVVRDRACKQCGKRPISGYSFCSKACRWQSDYTGRKERGFLEANRERNRLAVAAHQARKVAARAMAVCAMCGTGFAPTRKRRFCSDDCRVAHYQATSSERGRVRYYRNWIPPQDRACEECGTTFTPTLPHMRHCSIECRRRIGGKVRRARLRQVEHERVSSTKVFERDGWLCHICGRKTLKDKRGKIHDRAPHLDHIVPLSLGGPHTYANTACACMKCNLTKGSRTLGQPSLLAA
jgi:5-methylcytosine-specific restriction endonuclease McrA